MVAKGKKGKKVKNESSDNDECVDRCFVGWKASFARLSSQAGGGAT